MESNQSAQSLAQTQIQPSSPQSTPVLIPQHSKLSLILLTIISLLFLSGLIYFYLQTKSLQLKLAQNTTQSQTPTTNIDPVQDEERRTLNYFNNELSDKYNNFIQIPPGHKVRRVSSIEGDSSWIVEISDSELEPQNHSIVEERDFYLFNPSKNIFAKLNSEPMFCFVEQAKRISLLNSRLLISGPCNIGYFTSLYSYNDDQVDLIPLGDPNKLLTTDKTPNTDSLVINKDKSSSGKLARAITAGEESIFVVDMVNHDGFSPPKGIDPLNPSRGLAIFDIETGELKDLIVYGNY